MDTASAAVWAGNHLVGLQGPKRGLKLPVGFRSQDTLVDVDLRALRTGH